MNLDLPRPSLGLVITTHVFLGVLFLVGLATIVFLPGFSSYMAAGLPEYADLRDPLLAIAIAFTTLGLIALVMVVLLVNRIYTQTVLSRPSLLWVDVIITALTLAVVLIISGFITISNSHAGNPFTTLIQAMACLTLVALACITLVLRSLLQSAIALRTELDEVV